jgi:hypothetical protein
VAIVDNNGNVLETRDRKGLRSFTSEEMDREWDSIAPPIAVGVLQKGEENWGDLRMVIARYEKLVAVFYYTKEFLVLLYLEPAAEKDVANIALSVRNIFG